MQFSIEIQGVKEVQRDLNKYSEKVRKGLARQIASTTTAIHAEASKDAPVHTGNLRRNIKFNVRDLVGTVFSNSKYGISVEQGQKPGTWPNVGDLMFWVKKKLKPSKKRLKSVTYLVGRKIYEKGTDAQPHFEPAVKKHEKRFYNNVEKIIRRG